MVYSVLFGSPLLPRAAQRFTATSGVVRGSALSLATTGTAINAKSLSVFSAGAGAARFYGTRSVWNVKSGRRYFLVWMVGFTAVAGLMQEFVGPYVIFHE